MTKRTIKTAVVMAVILMLGGCLPEVRYSPTEITSFPSKTQDQIKSGEITLGMTPAAVRYTWGAPDEVRILANDSEGRAREDWIYSVAYIYNTRLVFVDGKLTGIIAGFSRDNQLLLENKPQAPVSGTTAPDTQPRQTEAPKEQKQ